MASSSLNMTSPNASLELDLPAVVSQVLSSPDPITAGLPSGWTVFFAALSASIITYHFTTQAMAYALHGKSLESIRRLARDLGLTPIRLALIYLNLAGVGQLLQGGVMSRLEYEQTQLSWLVLAAGYAFELTGYVSEIRNGGSYAMSLVHHTVGLSVALAVNQCVPYSPTSGRHWLRLLAGELVFAVALGGIMTSSLRVLYFWNKTAPSSASTAHPLAVRWTAFALTWGLTLAVTAAWWCIIGSYHVHSAEMYGFLGWATSVAFGVAFFLFWVQWKWIFLWHVKKNKLWGAGHPGERSVLPVSVISGASLVGVMSGSCLCVRSMLAQAQVI